MHTSASRRHSLYHGIAALSFASLLVACGGDAADDTASANKADSPNLAGAIVDVASREAAGVRLKPLDTPLPGGVIPDFTYGVILDMTNAVNATVTMRQVSMRIREIEADAARDVLVRQYLAAGFDTSAVRQEKATYTASFSQGGEAAGLGAAMSGGTSVVVLATPSKPDSENLADGFTAVLMITVYAPTQ